MLSHCGNRFAGRQGATKKVAAAKFSGSAAVEPHSIPAESLVPGTRSRHRGSAICCSRELEWPTKHPANCDAGQGGRIHSNSFVIVLGGPPNTPGKQRSYGWPQVGESYLFILINWRPAKHPSKQLVGWPGVGESSNNLGGTPKTPPANNAINVGRKVGESTQFI